MNELALIQKQKKNVIARIQKALSPILYESGFTTGKIGNSRPLKLYKFPEPVTIEGEKIIAVTEFGIATDVYGGGLVQGKFNSLSIELLLKLEFHLKRCSDVKNE